MSRREVYATSGTRMSLRFFAGAWISPKILLRREISRRLTQQASPWAVLFIYAGTGYACDKNTAPRLFVWATQDPDNAPLAKIQIIKGWLENGEAQEKVFDIACGRLDADGECVATLGASRSEQLRLVRNGRGRLSFELTGLILITIRRTTRSITRA